MKRSVLLSSISSCLCLGLVQPSRAASPDAPPPTATSATKPAASCLADVRAFNDEMRKGGYWLGGTGYGYGYPMGGVGYGYAYPTGASADGQVSAYENARPGYEVRILIASANILAQNGQQQPCEDVLATTRDLYKRYVADLHGRGMATADSPGWQQREITDARTVADSAGSFRSDQLLDTDVRSTRDQPLGSVHDLVISPKTGKIAYVVIGRGGVFGFGEKYIPVPWDDFKVTRNVGLLVLDTTPGIMASAPEVSDDHFATTGGFAEESQTVDTYWKTNILNKPTN